MASGGVQDRQWVLVSAMRGLFGLEGHCPCGQGAKVLSVDGQDNHATSINGQALVKPPTGTAHQEVTL